LYLCTQINKKHKKMARYRKQKEDAMGLRFDEGKIIDATFVEAPKQHNTPDKNKKIKEGEGDSLWNAEEGDTAEEKARKKSKSRCRIEHIFGFIEGPMNGSLVRSIGIMRAKAASALTFLVYNIFRYTQICKYQPKLINAIKG